MKMKLMQFMTLLALFATSAMAAQVDLKNSKFTWHGAKVTGKHYGQVPLKSGTVEMKGGWVSTGSFEADLTAFTVTDLKGEWATKFLNHMKGEDFFETGKYPTAKLVIKSVKDKVATADLTIKGKTNEVKFPIDKKDGKFVGTLKFDRTKFDMKYGSKSFFKSIGDKAIDDEVKVDFAFAVK